MSGKFDTSNDRTAPGAAGPGTARPPTRPAEPRPLRPRRGQHPPLLESHVPREVVRFIISLGFPAADTAKMICEDLVMEGSRVDVDFLKRRLIETADAHTGRPTAGTLETKKDIILKCVLGEQYSSRAMSQERQDELLSDYQIVNALYFRNEELKGIFDAVGSALQTPGRTLPLERLVRAKAAALEKLVRMAGLAHGVEKLEVPVVLLPLMQYVAAHGCADPVEALGHALQRMESGGLENVKTQYGGVPWASKRVFPYG